MNQEKATWMCALLLMWAFVGSATVSEEEQALLNQKENLNDYFGNLISWSTASGLSPCEWFHIGCSNGSVTNITLGGRQLSGSLVCDLGRLQNLQRLEMQDNSLTEEIPWALGMATRLQHMNLSNNWLTGGIPHSLTKLPHLRSIDLSNNNLTGIAPKFHKGVYVKESASALVLRNHKKSGIRLLKLEPQILCRKID
ncbi:hypothetical protein Mapa_005041 [Marchantia paleacea]|nr:hypothetical protein Mapa_005041 [Marchantia paleacea]